MASRELQPPAPVYILRGHPSQVHALQFCRGNTRLLSGDADGWVVLWGISSRRPVVSWKAHEGAILGVREWGRGKVITHGRDNKLFVWKLAENDEGTLDKFLPTDVDEYKLPECRKPWLLNSLDCNSLNFCGFALCPEEEGSHVDSEKPVLVALPSLTDSDNIDIWRLPGSERVHSAIGASDTKTGMAMGLELFHLHGTLNVAAGFESGHVCLFRWTASVDGGGQGVWNKVFAVQPHSQPSLSIAVSFERSFVVSTSADAVIVKLAIPDPREKDKEIEVVNSNGSEYVIKKMDTQHSGQQGVRLRNDDKIFATAGWDSKVRVYSGRAMKELAVLKWHREGCYAVAFANVRTMPQFPGGARDEEHELKLTAMIDPQPSNYVSLDKRREQREVGRHWLASGAKDGKIALWEIY